MLKLEKEALHLIMTYSFDDILVSKTTQNYMALSQLSHAAFWQDRVWTPRSIVQKGFPVIFLNHLPLLSILLLFENPPFHELLKVHFKECNAHSPQLFYFSKIIKIADKVKTENCLFINKYTNNKLPLIITDWFTFSSLSHKYQTSFASKRNI